jgi:hypothetical protein
VFKSSKKSRINPFLRQLFLNHKVSARQTFRTYNPEKQCSAAKDTLTGYYLVIGSLTVISLVTFPATSYIVPTCSGLGVLGFFLSQIYSFEQRRKREEEGRKTEEEVAIELWESFKNRGISLYSSLDLEHSVLDSEYFDSRLYIECKKDLDIFAVFPSGVSFKILVSLLPDATITFNENNETLRYAYNAKNRGKIKPEPLKEILSSERWLLRNRPQIVKQPSTKILVFVGASIADHKEYLYDSFGGQKLLRAWRENQPVYVTSTKEEVCTLIEAKLNS